MATAEEMARELEILRTQMEALKAEKDGADADKARLQEELNAYPRNAKEYMHPELRVPESPIVLPAIEKPFEIKSQFISLIKRAQFEGKPAECPMEIGRASCRERV